jgi:hypothetical protein
LNEVETAEKEISCLEDIMDSIQKELNNIFKQSSFSTPSTSAITPASLHNDYLLGVTPSFIYRPSGSSLPFSSISGISDNFNLLIKVVSFFFFLFYFFF